MALKYPIVMLIKKEFYPYVYTFDERENMHKSSVDIVNSERVKGMKIIDSEGFIYKVKNIHIVRYLGLWGFTLRYRGRSVYVDYEYEKNIDSISLEDFRDEIIKRVRRASFLWEESYGSLKELLDLINQARSYEEIMMLIH